MKRLIVVCEKYDKVRKAFEDRGWDAWSLDLEPSISNEAKHYTMDAVDFFVQNKEHWDMMICFPPCTYLSNSGNSWLVPKNNKHWYVRVAQRKAAAAFARFLFTQPIEKIAMENPTGGLSTLLFPGDKKLSKPTQYIQPYEHGHQVSKKTCLWLKNLPPLKPTKMVEPVWHTRDNGKRESLWNKKIGDMSDKSKRGELKSITFDGVAEAMANQWSDL